MPRLKITAGADMLWLAIITPEANSVIERSGFAAEGVLAFGWWFQLEKMSCVVQPPG